MSPMSDVEEVESRVRNLSQNALAQFREWFHEFENEHWGQQIQPDFNAGKFKEIIATAREEFAEGKAREI